MDELWYVVHQGGLSFNLKSRFWEGGLTIAAGQHPEGHSEILKTDFDICRCLFIAYHRISPAGIWESSLDGKMLRALSPYYKIAVWIL